MPQIQLLDEATIEKIAAGEVVERPSSVVKELVENAIDAKATFITVEIKEGGLSFIRITDNGCGIKPEDQTSVFEPFITHKADGTGLGLAITRRIILAHHGTITLDSTPGTGTTFSIALPIQENS